jgi:hypothetical protein
MGALLGDPSVVEDQAGNTARMLRMRRTNGT